MKKKSIIDQKLFPSPFDDGFILAMNSSSSLLGRITRIKVASNISLYAA